MANNIKTKEEKISDRKYCNVFDFPFFFSLSPESQLMMLFIQANTPIKE